MYLKYFFYILIFLITNISFSNSLENKILIKVNNEIITTTDILNEINYLYIVNSEASKLKKNLIIEIAKNNLIKNKIKSIELLKKTKEVKINDEYLNNLITKNFENYGFNNLEQYIKYLNNNDVNFEKVKEKITLDIIWRQYIYQKYKNKIKINKELIRKNVNEEKIKIFHLSEILFNVKKNENMDKKLLEIENSILKKGFKNTAAIYSISDTSSNGGDIGWIKASAISSRILNELNLITTGNYTKPIKVVSGFIILKINNYKEEKKNIDVEKEIDRITNIKINEQLKQFSNIYMEKLRKDVIINEL